MWYLYGVALIAGIASAIEPGQNASLAKATGNPLFAGLVCCGLGLLAFAGLMLATGRLTLPEAARAAQVPWWAWLGGLLGAVVVASQLTVSQKIGAAPFLAIVVTAGVVTSIGLDHFGFVGFERHAVSLWRVLGALLMVAGVTLVAVF